MSPQPLRPRIESGVARSRRAARVLRAAAAAVALFALGGGLWPGAGRGALQDGESEDFRIGLPSFVQGDDIERPRAIYRDSSISVNDLCAVRRARLDPMRDPVYVNGKAVGFCCTPCPAIFSLNPERYIPALHVRFDDPVTAGKKAIIDSSRRLMIGQDIYFFSSLATMQRFRKNPLAFCGKLTDPVTHARFRPVPTSPHVVYRSRDYWFASDSTKAEFQAAPARYADRTTGS